METQNPMPSAQSEQSHDMAHLRRDLHNMRVVYGISLIVVILVITACVPLFAPELLTQWFPGATPAVPNMMTVQHKDAGMNAPAVKKPAAGTATSTTATSTMSATTTTTTTVHVGA